MKFTITIKSDIAIKKLESLGRKKGEYIDKLIEKDMEYKELEERIKKLERMMDK